jgi:hypothetical protein
MAVKYIERHSLEDEHERCRQAAQRRRRTDRRHLLADPAHRPAHQLLMSGTRSTANVTSVLSAQRDAKQGEQQAK